MSDAITLFAGPSLRAGDLDTLVTAAARSGRHLTVRPPVRRLDLRSLAEADPGTTVLILDGEFGQNLAVSIAEIRSVLSAGLRVHGASSMGVLRAVECRTLGMTGSGWVYERYRSGRLDSDADVALMFDPYDYEPVTIPLVNLRWLIGCHVAAGTLAPGSGRLALTLAAGLHFRERRPSKLATTWRRGLPAAAHDLLGPELGDDRRDGWDRKRLDGIEAAHLLLEA
jgi:hypothetical protein